MAGAFKVNQDKLALIGEIHALEVRLKKADTSKNPADIKPDNTPLRTHMATLLATPQALQDLVTRFKAVRALDPAAVVQIDAALAASQTALGTLNVQHEQRARQAIEASRTATGLDATAYAAELEAEQKTCSTSLSQLVTVLTQVQNAAPAAGAPVPTPQERAEQKRVIDELTAKKKAEEDALLKADVVVADILYERYRALASQSDQAVQEAWQRTIRGVDLAVTPLKADPEAKNAPAAGFTIHPTTRLKVGEYKMDDGNIISVDSNKGVKFDVPVKCYKNEKDALEYFYKVYATLVKANEGAGCITLSDISLRTVPPNDRSMVEIATLAAHNMGLRVEYDQGMKDKMNGDIANEGRGPGGSGKKNIRDEIDKETKKFEEKKAQNDAKVEHMLEEKFDKKLSAEKEVITSLGLHLEAESKAEAANLPVIGDHAANPAQPYIDPALDEAKLYELVDAAAKRSPTLAHLNNAIRDIDNKIDVIANKPRWEENDVREVDAFLKLRQETTALLIGQQQQASLGDRSLANIAVLEALRDRLAPPPPGPRAAAAAPVLAVALAANGQPDPAAQAKRDQQVRKLDETLATATALNTTVQQAARVPGLAAAPGAPLIEQRQRLREIETIKLPAERARLDAERAAAQPGGRAPGRGRP